MSQFEMYLRLGFQHIINIHGYDHIVFVLVLCAAYSIKQINKVLLLVTAFTIGHSLTLALSTLNIFTLRSDIVEFLIPATILITAVSNVLPLKSGNRRFVYIATLFFGLIHGLGFSNYLKELLGRESNILTPRFLRLTLDWNWGKLLSSRFTFLFCLLPSNYLACGKTFGRFMYRAPAWVFP